jgi:hypothetical protein
MTTDYEFGIAAMLFGAVMCVLGFLGGYFHPVSRAKATQ